MNRAQTNKAALFRDAAVKEKTGKVWSQWIAILDKWGAAKKPHKEMAAYLHKQYQLPAWWAQMVTVGYERARGLRAVHQTAEGFTAGRSLTVNVPVSKLYGAWKDPASRKRWLKGDCLEVTTARPNKAIRGGWDGEKSRVDVMFYVKGASKSQITIDHRRLANAKEVRTSKAYWGEQLERLRALLEHQAG